MTGRAGAARALARAVPVLVAIAACTGAREPSPHAGGGGAPADPVAAAAAYGDSIERALPSLDCRTFDVVGLTLEGGEATACARGPQVVRIDARLYGESFGTTDRYLLRGDTLLFASALREEYDEPLSGRVVSRAEQRWWFAGGRLARWTGPDGAARDPAGAAALASDSLVRDVARRLVRCARETAPRGECVAGELGQ